MAVTGVLAYRHGRDALERETFARLTALRETKKRHIQSYFAQINQDVAMLAQAPATLDAMLAFRDALESGPGGSEAWYGDRSAWRDGVRSYYEAEFIPRLGGGEQADEQVDGLLPTSPAALWLQHIYIVGYPHETGKKDVLADANDGSAYSAVHARHHRHF